MTNTEYKLKAATTKWMLQQSDRYTHAVTLTLKPYRIVMTERGEIPEPLSIYSAISNMRHFINRLNCNLFNTAMRRNGASIAILPVLEGEATHKLLHYHCAIGNFPAALCDKAIAAKIKWAWQQTHFGNEQIDIQRIQTTGWLTYMGKEVGRKDACVIDWENLRK